MKQLAFKNRKSYEYSNSKKLVNYWMIYRDYEETKLISGIKKVELLASCRIRGLKSNIDKWKFLNNGKVITNFCLLQHIWKSTIAILTKQYIKSSDFALLYSEVNSYKAYNKLIKDIFLNHTFNKDNFTIIRAFKEDTLPERRVTTEENYKLMYHIFTKSHLILTEAADYRYKCSKDNILYDMSIIDQWYNEML